MNCQERKSLRKSKRSKDTGWFLGSLGISSFPFRPIGAACNVCGKSGKKTAGVFLVIARPPSDADMALDATGDYNYVCRKCFVQWVTDKFYEDKDGKS